MHKDRRHPRFTKRLETKFSSGGKSFSGLSSNLSESGLFIRTKHSFVPGTIIDIELHLPNGSVSFLKGIVRRSIRLPLPEFKSGMGIELIEKDALYPGFVKFLSGERGDQPEGSTIAATMPAYQIVTCSNCNTKNRVPVSKISMGPRCGRCKTPLSIIMPSS